MGARAPEQWVSELEALQQGSLHLGLWLRPQNTSLILCCEQMPRLCSQVRCIHSFVSVTSHLPTPIHPPPPPPFSFLHLLHWCALHLPHKSALRPPAWAAEQQKTETLHHFSPCPSLHSVSIRVTILYCQWLQRLQDKPDWQVCLSQASKPRRIGQAFPHYHYLELTHPRQTGELPKLSHWCVWWFLAPRHNT